MFIIRTCKQLQSVAGAAVPGGMQDTRGAGCDGLPPTPGDWHSLLPFWKVLHGVGMLAVR